MPHTVLLVDDEPHVISGLARILRKEPYELLSANSAEEAAGVLASREVDLIVTDEDMPGMSGTELLAKIAHDRPDVVGIVLTGHPTLPAALRAINEGKVYQFFTKPCNEIDLAITIRRALEQKDLQAKSRELLDVTKCQGVLLDEARVLRRLQGEPPKGKCKGTAKGDTGSALRPLLDEMEQEIHKSKVLLGALGAYKPSSAG